MTNISERAKEAAGVKMMPEHEWPLSEQFRVVAKAWAEKNAAANLLEETKSAVLSRMMMRHADQAVSRAEMLVKSSGEWSEFLEKMVEARKEADLAKVKMEYVRMRFSEWQSADANERSERKMVRQAT